MKEYFIEIDYTCISSVRLLTGKFTIKKNSQNYMEIDRYSYDIVMNIWASFACS